MTTAATRRKALYLGTAIATTLLAPGFTAMPAMADPTPNATPVFSANGGADIHADPAPGASGVIVDLQDDNRIITWSSFKVGKNATVDFITGNTTNTYAALNRVTGGGGTEIYGALRTGNNGHNNIDVYLIDTNGITFGPTGTYSGGSLSLSTIDLTDADFLDNYDATPAAGQSLNYSGLGGSISIMDGAALSPTGNLILASPQIGVDGSINASGEVTLVAAKNVTFTSGIGSPLSFTITTGTPIATGVAVGGTADIKGGSIALVGVSEVTAVSTLLSVASGAKLTATANNGSVILATADTGSISVPENGDGIAFNGSILNGAGKTGVTAKIVAAGALAGSGTVNVSGAGTVSGASVNLSGNVTTGAGLDVDATSGNATLSGTLSTGGVTTVDASGTVKVTDLTASAGNVTLTGAAITLDGATLNAQAGALALAGPATTTDTTSTLSGTSISLGTVAGDAAGHGVLVLNSSGTTTLGGAIGATNEIKRLTTNAGGSTAINGGSVRTSDTQTYNDAVVLGANTTFTSTGNKDITFAGTINGSIADLYSLTTVTTGDTIFGGQVGGTAALSKIDTDLAGTTRINTSLIKTSGNQTYGNIVLGANTKLQSTALGTLALKNVDGAFDLSLQTGGFVTATQFGGTTPLTGLAVRAAQLSIASPTQDVGKLAADISSAALTFANAATLSVNTVDGLVGIKAPSVNLSTSGGSSDLKVDAAIQATGIGGIQLSAARDLLVNEPLSADFGPVTLSATRDATVAANVTAGAGNYTASAVNLTLGKAATTVVQKATGLIDLTATTGDLVGLGDLDLISNSAGTAPFSSGATQLSATGGKIDLGLASSISASHAYVGVRAAAGQVIALGDVNSLSLFGYLGGGAYSASVTRTGSLTAGDVTLEDGLVVQLTSGNFRARSVTLTGPVFINGPQILLNVQGDVTGVAQAPTTEPTNSDPNFGRLSLNVPIVSVAAAGLVQLGTVLASSPGTTTISGGNYLGSGSNGSVDVATLKNPGGDIAVTAYATATPNDGHDGDIIVGFVDGGGAVTLDNKTAGGTKGDIVVTDAVRAAGAITLKSADDVLITPYSSTASAGSGAGAGTGFLRSFGGSLTVEAQGSVYGIGGAENSIGTTARGIGALGAVGDLTVTSTGDVRLGSVSAGGNLVLDIAGSLTGIAGGSPGAPLIGGSLFAEAPAQSVTVRAGLGLAGTTDVITLDQVKSSSVTLQADLIGVNALTNSFGTASYTSPYYFGTYTVGSSSIPLGDAEGDGITTLPLFTADSPGTDRLNPGFGSVDLSAGLSITTAIGHPIGYGAILPTTSGAQLGTVQAGTTIDIDAPAIVAGSVTSTAGAIDLLATAGTLSLTSASAFTNLTLTKLGGAPANVGDELRVGTAVAGRSTPAVVAGAVNLTSSTSVRTDSATAQGNLTINAGNDVTGTLGGTGTGTAIDALYGRAGLTANGASSDLLVTAGGLVQLAGAAAGRTIDIRGGNAFSDGAIDITSATAGSNLLLRARAIAPLSPANHNGDILLGSGSASGSALIENFTAAGDVGDIAIADRVTAAGSVQVHSANDIRLAQYNAAANGGTGSGLLRATSGVIEITARGSVYTTSDNSLGTAARGINTLTGSSLTVSSTGDARINSIGTSGSLQLNIAGSLSGTAATGTVTGASLFANGVAGSISVQAGTAPTDVAVFDQVQSSGSVAISAGAIGINTLTATGGPVSLTGAHYVGTASVGSNLSLTDAEGPATNAVNGFTAYVADTLGSVDMIDPAFGRTAINAGAAISTPSAIGGFAQLGNVTAGTSVSLQAKAISGDTVTADNGFITMTASQGTLSLVKADASASLTLTKQAGSLANAGDELRVNDALAGTPGAGLATLNSSTHVRGQVTSQGVVSITAVGDVTGIKGGSGLRTDSAYDRMSISAADANADITVTAGGLAQLGTVSAPRDAIVIAGDATHDGAIDASLILAGNNISLTAISTAPSAPIDRGGDILLGRGQALIGSATLTNTAGDSGDIVIGDRLTAATSITLNSTDDVRLTQYDAAANSGAGTGYLRTLGGALAINADGSVYTTQENALEASRRGIDLLTGNNLTIASPGDVRLDSITVTGNLAFDIAGSLTGRLLGGGGGGGTTTVNGAALFAQGPGSNVTVRAGLAGLPTNDIISLDQIVASGAVSLSADEIAVRDIHSDGNVTLSGAYYLGSVTIGGGTITLGDGDGNGIDAVNLFTADESAVRLAPGFGKASISAGGSVTSPSATSIGQVAQLGTVDAASIDLDAKAITADTLTAASGAIALTATAGTLAVGTANAATGLTLIKQGGAIGNVGDELRLANGSAHPASPAATILDSSTALRVGTVTSQGPLSLTARAGDVTGLKGASTGTTDTAYGRATLTATGASGDISVFGDGLAQLGPVTAGNSITVTVGNFGGSGRDGAIDVSTATASAGNLLLTATATSPATDTAHDGDILLGTGIAGALARLSNVIAGGNIGAIEIATSLTAGADAIVDSAAAARLAPIVSSGGTIAVRARTSVAGYAAGTGATLTAGTGINPTSGQDVTVRAGTTANIATVRADDDISIVAGGALAVSGTVTTTGLGPDTRAMVFTDPTTITSVAETAPGSTIALIGDGVTVSGLIKSAGSVAVIGGPSAATAAITAAGPVSVLAGTVDVAAVTATGSTGSVTLTANTGALTAASVSAGGSATLTGATNVAVAGATSAAGDLTVTAPGAVLLANASGANVSLTGGTLAAGAVTATGNLIAKSTTGALTLASGSAGGTASLTAATSATVTGPLSATSDLTVTAPGAVALATVSGRNIALTGSTLTAGAVTATGNLTANATTGALSLASATAAGTANLAAQTTATVTGALNVGSDLTVTAPGAVTLAAVSGRTVSLTGGTLTTGAVTATGDLVAKSTTGAVTLASAAVSGATTITGATVAAVSGSLNAGGDLTVTAPGAVTLAAVGGRNVTLTGATVNAGATTATGALGATSNSGALTLASANVSGAATLKSAAAATVTGALSAGGDVSVTAPGAVTLGSLGGRAVTVTGTTATIGPVTATGALTVTTDSGALTMGAATAGGAVNLAVATKATLAGVGAGANAVTLTAADADISGTISGSTIKVVDRSANPNSLVLGDGTSETGFNLSQDEVNRLNAATVTLDAGTALANPQNIRIGTLGVDSDTGATALNLLGVRRIDVTGVLGMTGSGSRALLIGGNGSTSDPLTAASVLRVASLGTGGGRIIVPGTALTLRANAIGVGQDALFLDTLGLNVGGTPLGTTLVATDYVGNTFSTLYSSIRGGTAYTDDVLLSAGSLTVRYSNFALFQNTGLVSANTGMLLQTSGGTALDIRGLGTTPGGPIAIFGSINGITNAAAAVLGEPIVTYSALPSIDRSSARINGCLIGSGSACIGLNINPAQLPALDPIRDQLIDRPEGLEIPFDPLVGTNNESLFGDVGSFGLSDVPLDLVECKKDESGQCETPAPGAN